MSIFGAIGAFITLPLLWMLVIDRGPVVELLNARMIPKSVVRGEKALVTWDARELRNCAGDVQRYIEDSAKTVFTFARESTVYHEAIKGDADKTFSREIRVPRGAAIGPAIYKSRIRRWCNFMQEIFWPMHEDGVPIHFNIEDRVVAIAPRS